MQAAEAVVEVTLLLQLVLDNTVAEVVAMMLELLQLLQHQILDQAEVAVEATQVTVVLV
jgi:hypothetical protein